MVTTVEVVIELAVVMLADDVSAVELEVTKVVVERPEDVVLLAVVDSDLCLQRLPTTPSRPARPTAKQKIIDERIMSIFCI